MFFQLGFEAFEQREGVGGAAGETGDHLAVVEAAHFARVALHDGIAQRYLAVAADHDVIAASNRDDGRAVILLHGNLLILI